MTGFIWPVPQVPSVAAGVALAHVLARAHTGGAPGGGENMVSRTKPKAPGDVYCSGSGGVNGMRFGSGASAGAGADATAAAAAAAVALG